MKKRNEFLMVIGCVMVSLNYVVYGYWIPATVILCLSMVISFLSLSPSKRSLTLLGVSAISIFILEMALLSTLSMIPSKSWITLYMIVNALSCGCWILNYRAMNWESQFRVKISIECLCAFFTILLFLIVYIPSSITDGFNGIGFISGRQGLIQIGLCLITPLIATFQWMVIVRGILLMISKVESKEKRKTVTLLKRSSTNYF